MAGLWCVNVGYGRREIADALRDEALRLGYYHAFSSMATDLPAEVAERVIGLYPVPMSKIFFGNSGSDANDTQVKLVWYYNNVLGRPEKKKIISRHRGYHGVTVMAGRADRARVAARRVRPAAADDPAHDAPRTGSGRRSRARATRSSRSSSRTSSSS